MKKYFNRNEDGSIADWTTVKQELGFENETEEEIVIYNGKQWLISEIDQEAYETEQKQKRRAELDKLTLTPADVERALYYSDLHMDFDDLKALIAERAPQIDLKGLAIEFRANNFFRGATDKDRNRIVDMIGQLLGYTSEDMDYLFEHKELPVKETAED